MTKWVQPQWEVGYWMPEAKGRPAPVGSDQSSGIGNQSSVIGNQSSVMGLRIEDRGLVCRACEHWEKADPALAVMLVSIPPPTAVEMCTHPMCGCQVLVRTEPWLRLVRCPAGKWK